MVGPVPHRRRLRRWASAVGFLFLALAVVAWFLPAIIAATSLKDRVVAAALPWFRGRVALEEMSLGWFSPVQVRGVTVYDNQGEKLAEVEEAATAKRLWDLLIDSNHLGEVHLTQPTVYCVVREGGSNWEDALAPLFTGESQGGVACEIKVIDGACHVRQPANPSQITLSHIDASIAVPADSNGSYQVRLTGNLSDGATEGAVEVNADWRPDASSWGVGRGKVGVHGAPMAALTAVATRWGIAAKLFGRATVRGEFELTESGRQSIRLERAVVEQLSASVPAYLKDDEVRLHQLAASGQVALTDHAITFHDFDVVSDVGLARISGSAPRSLLHDGQWIAGLRRSTFNINGELDLARLAALLPRTLQLRDGLQVTSGIVRLTCATADEDQTRQWQGRLETSQLAAMHQGRPVAWERPLSAAFIVRDEADGLVLEQLTCESDFLRVQGQGSLHRGNLSLEGDLSKLLTELRRFVDLGQMEFGGVVQGQIQWRRTEAGQTAADGQMRLTDFQWSAPGRRLWREPHLIAGFSAQGEMDRNGVRRIDHAQMELQAGNDSAKLHLLEPIESLGKATSWPVQIEAQGEFATWLPRAANLLTLPPWKLDGRMAISARGVVSAEHANFQQVTAVLEPVDFQGHGLTIREPRIETQADLTWMAQPPRLTLQQATLASSTVAFRAEGVQIDLPPTNIAASAAIDFRGDLQRVSQWFRNPKTPPSWQMLGMAVGRVRIQSAGPAVQIQGASDIENFAFETLVAPTAQRSPTAPVSQSGAWSTLWRESKLSLAFDGNYHSENEGIEVQQVTIAGEAVQVRAQGRVAQVSTACNLLLSGQYDYDLAKLAAVFRPWVGDGLMVAGRGPRPFTIQGPLLATSSSSAGATAPFVPNELHAVTNVAWSSIAYRGIRLGAGETPVELRNGVVTFGPLDLPVSEGRLTAAPKVLVNASPMVLVVDAGPILQNVRISPEMCHSWLKYVAPLVADAAQAEGRFSVELTRPAQIALENPWQSAVQGVMHVHAAQVGPGSLSRQFLTLADQVQAAVERKPLGAVSAGADVWLQMPQQTIGFEMADGRVHHRDLQMVSKDVAIRTRGSVGLDQSLDLIAEIPIQDRWVEREPLLAGFRGKTLQIPVGGSLTAPKLDRRGLEQFTQQMVGDAARQLLEKSLNSSPDVKKTLERLFRGP